MINFRDRFPFFCTLKYVNMTRISNISFFRFCWKNEKLDWPKCARTPMLREIFLGIFNWPLSCKGPEYQRLFLFESNSASGNGLQFRSI